MNTLVLIMVAVLGFVAVAGLGFVFVGGDSGSSKTAKRVQAVAGPKEKGGRRVAPAEAAGMRRKQILENLKANEKQSRKQRLSIDARLNDPFGVWQLFFKDPFGANVELDFDGDEVPPDNWPGDNSWFTSSTASR